MLTKILICLAVGYFCGCFSTGYFVGKANHIDIRAYGSGNAGATNTLRTLGVKAGAITFLGDALKAILPILAFRMMYSDAEPLWQLYGLYTAIGVTLGHNFPFYLNFKGGKGIAVMAGAIIALTGWEATLIALAIFAGIVYFTRYVSLGSLIVAWVLPIHTVLNYRNHPAFLHMFGLCMFITVLAYVRHRANIKRLLSGTERKIGEKSTK